MNYRYACAVTGGIATGKSTLCSALKMHGFEVIDADLIAKEQLELSRGELRELFGDEVFCGDEIDRKRLGEVVFGSKEHRCKLNSLIHPKVRCEIEKEAMSLEKLKLPYVMDIPLFFESGEYDCAMSVVVYTPEDIQMERLMLRDTLSRGEAKSRVDAQMSMQEKKRRADWVVDNSTDLKHLQSEIKRLEKHIRGEYASIKI